MIKRCIDICLSLSLLSLAALPMILIAVLVKVTSPGPALHWSHRIGRHNRLFSMPKFRTMRTDTPQLATHLLGNATQWLTPIGEFLRSTSIDELPQLWSVLRGDMSFVGPRPALFNQDDLIALRTAAGVDQLVPGITGWAQVNGRDELSIESKVKLDKYYLQQQSCVFDFRIMLLTAAKVLSSEGVVDACGKDDRARTSSPRRRAA